MDPTTATRARAAEHLVVLALYVLLALLVLRPALGADRVLSSAAGWATSGPFPAAERLKVPPGVNILSDSSSVFVPHLRWGADALAEDGRVPLWKPTAACGAPYVGNGQSAVFFPPTFLALRLGAPPWIHAALAGLKLVVGAFGAWALARHLGLSRLASLAAGLVYGFAGFQVVFLLYPLTSVSMLLPLLLLATDRAAQACTWPRLGLVALVAGLQHLAGHPETALHSQLLAAALALVRVLSLRAAIGGRAALARVLWVAAAYVVGATLGAVQTLPLLEYVRESDALFWRQLRRTELRLEHPLQSALFVACVALAAWCVVRIARTAGRIWPWALVLLLSVAGGVSAGLAAGLPDNVLVLLASDWFGPVSQYAGDNNYLEGNGAFVGAALAPALLGLLAGRPRWLARTAGVLLALGLLAGFRAPGIKFVLESLPLLDLAENTRLQLVALLALAVLAGLGLDALGAPHAPRLRRRLLCVGTLPVLGVLLALGVASQRGELKQWNTPALPPAAQPVPASLLPLELQAQVPPPGLPPEPAEALAPHRVAFGLLDLPEKPFGISVLYTSAWKVKEAQWVPAPDDAGAAGASGARTVHRFVFRAAIPDGELAPGPAFVRIRAALPYREAVSTLVRLPDADTPDWAAWPLQPMQGRSHAQLAALAAAFALVLSLLDARGALRTAARIVLLVLVAATLMQFAQPTQPVLPRSQFYPPSGALRVLQERLPPSGRMLPMRASSFPAEIPTYYGIPDVRGYDALHPRRVVRLLSRAAAAGGLPTAMDRVPTRPDPDLRLLGLMAVRYLVDFDHPPADLPRVRFDGEALLPPWDPFHMAANPQFLPRARLVTGAVVEPDDDRALDRLAAPDFPLASCIVLASGEPRPPSELDPGPATIVKDRPEIVRVNVEPHQPGWLVLADTFFPGWKALVDGEEREVVRANVAFRAVAVRPGDKQVEFRYEPRPYRVGGVLSALSAAAVLAALLAGLRRKPAPGTGVRETGAPGTGTAGNGAPAGARQAPSDRPQSAL